MVGSANTKCKAIWAKLLFCYLLDMSPQTLDSDHLESYTQEIIEMLMALQAGRIFRFYFFTKRTTESRICDSFR